MAPSQVPPRYNVGFYPSEQRHQRYTCYVPEGFSLEEALKPVFWQHTGHMLKREDEIVLYPDDMSWRADLVVVDAGPLWARVALIRKTDLATQSDDASALSIEWSGPATKFRVLRGKDVLKDGFLKRPDAKHWIDTEYAAKSKAA